MGLTEWWLPRCETEEVAEEGVASATAPATGPVTDTSMRLSRSDAGNVPVAILVDM